MNLPRLQSIVAPVATPAAPAVLLANEIYRVMVSVNINNWIAFTTSIIAIVGIEFSGALMCYNAIEAYRRRTWVPMLLAIAGAIVYAIIVIVGVASMPEERGQVLGVMVLLTLVSYLGYAIYTSFDKQDQITVAVVTSEIDLLNAKRQLVNAETRHAKTQQPALDMSILSSRQLDTPNGQVDITETGQRIMDYLTANNGSGSLRTIAAACDCSPETARQWKIQWTAKQC